MNTETKLDIFCLTIAYLANFDCLIFSFDLPW